jgi:hypothetical protein
MFTNKLSYAAYLTLAASMAASAQTPFVLSNVNSALVPDVPGAVATVPFSTIPVETPNGGSNQQWVLHRPSGATAYEIRSVVSGFVMDAPLDASGSLVQQFPAGGGNNQLWQISRAAGSTGYEILSPNLVELQQQPPCIAGGPYICTARLVPLALEVPASAAAGTPIQVSAENNATNQQWLFNPQFPTVEAAINFGRTILLSPGSTSITINGFGFPPNSEVCPVLESAAGIGFTTAPCATTSVFGGFSYVFPLPLLNVYFSNLSGYVVMTVEDANQNLLAIASVAGAIGHYTPIQK